MQASLAKREIVTLPLRMVTLSSAPCVQASQAIPARDGDPGTATLRHSKDGYSGGECRRRLTDDWGPTFRKGMGRKTRPIGIPTFEDKVLQRAVVMVLESVYEQDFRTVASASALGARLIRPCSISGSRRW